MASDHSVAILNLKDKKCVLLASCHTFPVEKVRWRPKENFVVVGCAEGTVYVWQTDTGMKNFKVSTSLAMPNFVSFRPFRSM